MAIASASSTGVCACDLSCVQLTHRQRRRRRRLSTPVSRQTARKICNPLPLSIEALDLSSASPEQALASLRYIILSYLADLERRLATLVSPDLDALKAMSETTIEDARAWAETAMEILNGIRADVCSHLPEFHFADMSMESFLKSHLPDFPGLSPVPVLTEMGFHLPDMNDVRSHLSYMPLIPDIQNVGAHISDMRTKLVQDVRSRFYDLDFNHPLSHIPTLSDHLKSLHTHLCSIELPSSDCDPSAFISASFFSDFLEPLLSSNIVEEILKPIPKIPHPENMLELAAKDVADGIRRSLHGARLIRYSDLPHAWRNNPFVTNGYRFIPLERWPLILMSLFALHNEILNIHTHLVPFLLWGIQAVPLVNPNYTLDTPETLFMWFALLCLFLSALWHTMSGCANRKSMEFCARVDYVGIGWLISASVGTIVHYGFHCYPSHGRLFLGLCLATGLAGNVFPFMEWFNQRKYRHYRIFFFLCLAFSAVGPLAVLSTMHSITEVFTYVAPVAPSLLSYIVGLMFYALHFPERILPQSIREQLDYFGISSHCIWHCFIVLAVSQHRSAIPALRKGIVTRCIAV